jgi:glycosyltransferase involved in cell wall biosynthesis
MLGSRQQPGGPIRARSIMAVNLYAGGHHPQHLQCLVDHWSRKGLGEELHLVVTEGYREAHRSLLESVDETSGATLHIVPGSDLVASGRTALLSSDRQHGHVIREWAARLGVEHVLLMYFDHVQISLARDLRFSWPLGISGIYFRPTFHYRDLGMDQSRVSAIRKRTILWGALRNPHLRYLFCLDPLAIKRFPQSAHVQAVWLPEPLDDRTHESATSPVPNAVEPGRRRLLLFGSIDERKGTVPMLDALAALREPDQVRLALLLMGRIDDGLRERVAHFAAASKVQVVLADRYVDEAEIQPTFRASDLVLLTYLHHIGSSGVLVRAARAEVPVLSTDYGLLGAQVRDNRLGAIVDATSSAAIRSVLEAWLADADAIPFDAERARAFASANTAEAFAETIFSHVLERRPSTIRDDHERVREGRA